MIFESWKKVAWLFKGAKITTVERWLHEFSKKLKLSEFLSLRVTEFWSHKVSYRRARQTLTSEVKGHFQKKCSAIDPVIIKTIYWRFLEIFACQGNSRYSLGPGGQVWPLRSNVNVFGIAINHKKHIWTSFMKKSLQVFKIWAFKAKISGITELHSEL